MNAPAVEEVRFETIQPWRERYREEMACQILQYSFHERPGWTRCYLLRHEGREAGYASLVEGGPWTGTRVLFECYMAPEARPAAPSLFRELVQFSGAVAVRTQTNHSFLTGLLYASCREIEYEKTIFHDRRVTAHASTARFRELTPDERSRFNPREVVPDFGLELDGRLVGHGGVLWHYNPPYGDLYMEIYERYRRQGLGRFLVQELKRVCRDKGGIPCARCSPENVASGKTLLSAGFEICGQLISGTIVRGSTPS